MNNSFKKTALMTLFLIGPTLMAAPLKIYYAHPLSIYDTKAEKQDLQTLSRLGLEVVNPNSPEVEARYQQTHNFDVFLDMVRKSDGVAFRAFPDGSIPSGVASEVAEAKKNHLIVIELPSAILKRSLTREQTREYLDNSGTDRK